MFYVKIIIQSVLWNCFHSADEEDLQLLSPEERERRSKFEQKRKMHYNEYYAVKMARQLMDQVN